MISLNKLKVTLNNTGDKTMNMDEILKDLRERYDCPEEIEEVSKDIKAIQRLLEIDSFYRSFEPAKLKAFKGFLEQVRFELSEMK
jgi:hypothetical protein